MGSNPAIPTKGTGVRPVAVLGTGTAVGAALADGLAAAGFDVRAVADFEPLPAEATAVVDAGALHPPSDVGALAGLDAAAWLRCAEEPMRRALHVLQRAHGCLRDGGGRIVVLLPSVVMTGAADLAAWTAAAEGYRSLAKAAARAWGPEGISVQSVLVPVSLVDGSLADRPGLQPPALGQLPDPRTTLAPAIAALLDQRLDTVTGLTIAVDGGVWMTS